VYRAETLTVDRSQLIVNGEYFFGSLQFIIDLSD